MSYYSLEMMGAANDNQTSIDHEGSLKKVSNLYWREQLIGEFYDSLLS
jgi:hypothetical protein